LRRAGRIPAVTGPGTAPSAPGDRSLASKCATPQGVLMPGVRRVFLPYRADVVPIVALTKAVVNQGRCGAGPSRHRTWLDGAQSWSASPGTGASRGRTCRPLQVRVLRMRCLPGSHAQQEACHACASDPGVVRYQCDDKGGQADCQVLDEGANLPSHDVEAEDNDRRHVQDIEGQLGLAGIFGHTICERRPAVDRLKVYASLYVVIVTICVTTWVACAALLGVAAYPVPRDVEVLRHAMRKRAGDLQRPWQRQRPPR
jgi:hypothetical protein